MVAITVVLASVLAAFVLSFSGASEAPMAKFDFEYTETSFADVDSGTVGDGVLHVTHVSGAHLPASNVYIRGSDGMGTLSTVWQGSMSGTADGKAAIVSGDTMTVGVYSNYDVKIVWSPSGEERSTTLASDSGPDSL